MPYPRRLVRSAAAVRIQNDVVALRGIQNGIGNHRNWLDRGMKIEGVSLTFARKAGVVPHIRAIATEATKLNIEKKNAKILRLEHFQTTATASRHMFIADARKARCVLAEMR